MRILALSAQSISEALAGTALLPRLRHLLVSMETTQSGLEPCQAQCGFISGHKEHHDH